MQREEELKGLVGMVDIGAQQRQKDMVAVCCALLPSKVSSIQSISSSFTAEAFPSTAGGDPWVCLLALSLLHFESDQ